MGGKDYAHKVLLQCLGHNTIVQRLQNREAEEAFDRLKRFESRSKRRQSYSDTYDSDEDTSRHRKKRIRYRYSDERKDGRREKKSNGLFDIRRCVQSAEFEMASSQDSSVGDKDRDRDKDKDRDRDKDKDRDRDKDRDKGSGTVRSVDRLSDRSETKRTRKLSIETVLQAHRNLWGEEREKSKSQRNDLWQSDKYNEQYKQKTLIGPQRPKTGVQTDSDATPSQGTSSPSSSSSSSEDEKKKRRKSSSKRMKEKQKKKIGVNSPHLEEGECVEDESTDKSYRKRKRKRETHRHKSKRRRDHQTSYTSSSDSK